MLLYQTDQTLVVNETPPEMNESPNVEMTTPGVLLLHPILLVTSFSPSSRWAFVAAICIAPCYPHHLCSGFRDIFSVRRSSLMAETRAYVQRSPDNVLLLSL